MMADPAIKTGPAGVQAGAPLQGAGTLTKNQPDASQDDGDLQRFIDEERRNPAYFAAVLARTYAVSDLTRRSEPVIRLEALIQDHARTLRALAAREAMPDKLQQFCALADRVGNEPPHLIQPRFESLSRQMPSELLAASPPRPEAPTPGQPLQISPGASPEERRSFENEVGNWDVEQLTQSLRRSWEEANRPASLYGAPTSAQAHHQAAALTVERIIILRGLAVPARPQQPGSPASDGHSDRQGSQGQRSQNRPARNRGIER